MLVFCFPRLVLKSNKEGRWRWWRHARLWLLFRSAWSLYCKQISEWTEGEAVTMPMVRPVPKYFGLPAQRTRPDGNISALRHQVELTGRFIDEEKCRRPGWVRAEPQIKIHQSGNSTATELERCLFTFHCVATRLWRPSGRRLMLRYRPRIWASPGAWRTRWSSVSSRDPRLNKALWPSRYHWCSKNKYGV